MINYVLNEDSVTVIGGADGPTSVFLTGSPIGTVVVYAVAVLAIVGTVLLIVKRRKEKH